LIQKKGGKKRKKERKTLISSGIFETQPQKNGPELKPALSKQKYDFRG
jgi:hypothetical protein